MEDFHQHLEKNGKIDIALLKQLLSDNKKIPNKWVKQLISKFTKVVNKQPNVMRICEPVIVIGDIHGQFVDLLKIISLLPSIETQPKQYLLFLGDYVDRGPQGVEVVLLLMALKLRYPTKVLMLRGNHQTRQMTQIMNFYQQCMDKYNQDIYFDIMDAFDALPLVCLVNDNYFCVHGGITSQGQSIEELQKLKRFDEVPLIGSICDLVWSDPVLDESGKIQTGQLFMPNNQRNCSIFFGSDHTRNFLKQNKLITIIRAHEVQLQGYKQHLWPKWKNIPMVYTIFSAPNYCGSYGNFGAILTISNSQFDVRQFKDSNPKYYLPANYNAFNFTLTKLYDFLNQIMKRMGKKVVANKFGDTKLKQLPVEDAIAIFLKSEKCKQLQAIQQFHQIKLKHQKKDLGEQETFRKSLGYFSESQKRPSSLIFSSKQ